MKPEIIYYHLKMRIDTGETLSYYQYSEIVCFVYEKPYCAMYCQKNDEQKKILLHTTLAGIEEKLPEVFFRCNRKVIINMSYLREYNKINYVLEMRDGSCYSLSRRRVMDFGAKEQKLARISPLCPQCYSCTRYCEGRDNLSSNNLA